MLHAVLEGEQEIKKTNKKKQEIGLSLAQPYCSCTRKNRNVRAQNKTSIGCKRPTARVNSQQEKQNCDLDLLPPLLETPIGRQSVPAPVSVQFLTARQCTGKATRQASGKQTNR